MQAIMAKPKQHKAVDAVPDGMYRARLAEVTQFTNAFGYRLGFVFEIEEGEQAGKRLMRSSSSELSSKGLLHQIISGILGRNLTAQELEQGFNVASLVNERCNILVKQAQSKAGQVFSNVEQVFKQT